MYYRFKKSFSRNKAVRKIIYFSILDINYKDNEKV